MLFRSVPVPQAPRETAKAEIPTLDPTPKKVERPRETTGNAPANEAASAAPPPAAQQQAPPPAPAPAQQQANVSPPPAQPNAPSLPPAGNATSAPAPAPQQTANTNTPPPAPANPPQAVTTTNAAPAQNAAPAPAAPTPVSTAVANPPPPAPAAQSAVNAPKTCDVQACSASYQSFRTEDCTYQPMQGERRVCTKRGNGNIAARAPAQDRLTRGSAQDASRSIRPDRDAELREV